MPKTKTIARARKAKRQGKAPSTQAGEFVRETIDDIRHGKHGARSTKQAIAIGLSKARRAGVKLPPPAKGEATEATRKQAARDVRKAKSHSKPSAKRSKAVRTALKHESRSAASHDALAKQARTAARKRGPASRKRAAQKAASTRRKSH